MKFYNRIFKSMQTSGFLILSLENTFTIFFKNLVYSSFPASPKHFWKLKTNKDKF